jgi:hypothetical protein
LWSYEEIAIEKGPGIDFVFLRIKGLEKAPDGFGCAQTYTQREIKEM